MERAENAVLSLVKDLGLDSSLRLYVIDKQWETIFHGPLSLHTSPVSLGGGQLLVNADSPVWLQQITFHKAEILKKLSAFGVRDVRFKLGRVRKRTEQSSPHEGCISDAERAFIEEVVSGIEDHGLGESIRRAMEKWALKERRRLIGSFESK